MNRQVIRGTYLVRAVMWGALALLFAAPAIKYLHEYGLYIRGGLNEFFK